MPPPFKRTTSGGAAGASVADELGGAFVAVVAPGAPAGGGAGAAFDGAGAAPALESAPEAGADCAGACVT
jgi:hypothetical protein